MPGHQFNKQPGRRPEGRHASLHVPGQQRHGKHRALPQLGGRRRAEGGDQAQAQLCVPLAP